MRADHGAPRRFRRFDPDAEPGAGGSARAGGPAAPDARAGIEALRIGVQAGLDRVPAAALPALLADGVCVVDIRGPQTRDVEGHIPGAVVVDRLVLEWRLCPTSAWRMAGAPELDDLVVLVCNEGYSSSLAAQTLQALGFHRATDLIGGFRAWAAAGLPIAGRPSRVVT